MIEIKSESGAGQIQIAEEVVAVIAGTAALEIDGVAGMAGNITGDIAEILGRKNLARGVKVEARDGCVSLDINVLLKHGFKLQDVSAQVQKRVKTAVETMTGLNAATVNVCVSGLVAEKEKLKETSSARNTDSDIQ